MGEWDAGTYQRISAPQVEWGLDVLDGVALRGDERALDAGCGTGRVTRLLAERLPRGSVLGVDASANMVAEAATQLADLAPRVRVERQDLLELTVAPPVDLIFSTATLHWIFDHERLFARFFAALAPGGRLVAQCGGAGNIAAAHAAADLVAARAPYAEHLPETVRGVHFADAPTTAHRLRAAGFIDVDTWLHERPADVGPIDDGALYLRTIALRPHIERLPEHLREPFARDAAEEMLGADGHVVVDYVRLEIRARRPPDQGGDPGGGG